MTRKPAVSGMVSTALAGLLATAPLAGQSLHDVVVAGYGTTQYAGTVKGPHVNGFSVSVSPVILYSVGRDFLFETELEFELEDGATNSQLEYAQLDYQGLEHVQFVAGKFLLPFGVFGERLHPSWVNKLATMPILFGHGEGGVPHEALLPVMSDVGAMVRWAQPFGAGWALNVSAYVTQGPSIAEAGAVEGEGMGMEEAESPAPTIAWGVAYADNNTNKMLGARLGVVKGPSFEAYLSGFHARYDPEQLLDVLGGALSAEWRGAGFQIRGEGVLLSQDFQDESGSFTTLDRSGLYIEASRRIGSWEPVARWGHLADGTVAGGTAIEGRSTLTVGLDYWFEPMIPLKVAYTTTAGRNDRFIFQWAVGF